MAACALSLRRGTAHPFMPLPISIPDLFTGTTVEWEPGVPPTQIDRIQKELLNLVHRVQPTYFPVVEPAVLDGRHILVIWIPSGAGST